MVSNVQIPLSGLVYKEDRWWLAHCLELDIVAEGDTPESALESCLELCDLQIRTAMEENDLQSIFRPAPPKLWDMYWRTTTSLPSAQLPKEIQRFEARQFATSA
jgi:predicted RNase H-like HicB family nuclease